MEQLLLIAYLDGQLIDRNNKSSNDNFHSICDSFTRELQECGCYLCDAKGHLRAPAKHVTQVHLYILNQLEL